MSSGHDHHDNHSNDPKEVSFRTPLILALVTSLIIVLAVNTCTPKKHCCEDGAKCEQEASGNHGHNAQNEHGTPNDARHEAQTGGHDEAAAQSAANVASPDSAAAHTGAQSPAAHQ